MTTRTIWKYTFGGPGGEVFSMPAAANVIHVAMQGGRVTLWAEVHPNAPKTQRRFEVFGTGHLIPESSDSMHVGSVLDGPFVWHVYEILSN